MKKTRHWSFANGWRIDVTTTKSNFRYYLNIEIYITRRDLITVLFIMSCIPQSAQHLRTPPSTQIVLRSEIHHCPLICPSTNSNAAFLSTTSILLVLLLNDTP